MLVTLGMWSWKSRLKYSYTSLLSQSVPDAKSHSLISPSPVLGLLLQPRLGSYKLHGSVLITPNWMPWASPHCIPICSQNSCQNSLPQPQRCSGLPRSFGPHVTIMQSCVTHATSLAGHL